MYKFIFRALPSVTIVIFSIIFSASAFAQVGSCVKGTYNVYDKECEKAEIDSRMCTTRIEQTPQSRWCCCNNDYPLSQCAMLFDAIFKGSESASSSSMMKNARLFRDGFLAKNKKGETYIKNYYDNLNEVTRLLLKNPSLAKETAQVIFLNQKLMSELTKGRKVKVEAPKMFSVLKLLERYAIASGNKSEITAVVVKLVDDLRNRELLEQLGIYPEDSYWEIVSNQADDGSDTDTPPTDDDPTTCDKPVGGMCPRQPKDDQGACPEGCNSVNATECSCAHKGPEDSGRTNPPTTETPGTGGGGNGGEEGWGDWLCRHTGLCF